MPIVNLANFPTFTAVNLNSDPGHIRGKKTIAQVAEITLDFAFDGGRTGHVVLHGRYAGAYQGSLAQANAIFSGLSTSATWGALRVTMATTTSFTGVSLRDLNTVDQPLVSSSGPAVLGTDAAVALPVESAVVITLRSALGGRSGRGRMYMGGFGSDMVIAGNLIAPGLVTGLTNWAGTISGVLGGSGYTWVIGLVARAAYTSANGTPHPARDNTTSPVIISAAVRDNHWDSQRRRGLR